MKDSVAKNSPQVAVLSLAQLLAEQPAEPPPGWIEPGLLPPQGILFVGGEPKVGKSLLVANLALALAAGEDRAGFTVPAARRGLVCQFELPVAQFVSRLAAMRRSLGTAADQNLPVDTRAVGHLLSAPQGLNHFLVLAHMVHHNQRHSRAAATGSGTTPPWSACHSHLDRGWNTRDPKRSLRPRSRVRLPSAATRSTAPSAALRRCTRWATATCC